MTADDTLECEPPSVWLDPEDLVLVEGGGLIVCVGWRMQNHHGRCLAAADDGGMHVSSVGRTGMEHGYS